MVQLQEVLFAFFIDLSRRILSLVDGVSLAWAAWRGAPMRVPSVGRQVRVPSGQRLLDGWLVESHGRPRAAVLLLHGIGDKLPYWRLVQHMLEDHGITSLVFDYSGYGASEGRASRRALEQDAVAAYLWLGGQVERTTTLFVLGYSLGSGLAAEVLGGLEPAAAGLILCQPYTTFREAAARVVRPFNLLTRLVPDLWRTKDRVRAYTLPLLVVHGADDVLFPVEMARTVHAAAASGARRATLAVVPGHAHNAGYLDVAPEYWEPVLRFVLGDAKRQ